MTHNTQERITAVREKLAAWEVDALYITNAVNRRWLSGFTGSAGSLLITADLAIIGTDFRYWEQAQQQTPDFELMRLGRGNPDLPTEKDLLLRLEDGVIGVEGDDMSINTFWQLGNQLEESNVQLKPLGNVISGMRDIKTAPEIEMIRQAAAITDWAMSQVNEMIQPGMLERDVAWELEKMMREKGADGVAFDIIVAGGPNAALAHHRPGERPLQEGDTIVIDMGAKLNGYHSDMTRSFHLGSNPSEKFWEIYNLVHKAQLNALENMKVGMSGQEIDALARDVIKEAGYGDLFGHSLGHGVGLEIHEGPRLSMLTKSLIPAGAVVSVEPGIYIPGWGGIRIEDLIVLTEEGPQFLSNCPKNPIIEI